MAHEAGARHLLAYSDSQLIVKQVEGAYEAKEENMIQYLRQIKELKTSFDHFQSIQIPPEENIKADCLSKLASALEDCRTRHITIQYLLEARASLPVQPITAGRIGEPLSLDGYKKDISQTTGGRLPDLRHETLAHDPRAHPIQNILHTPLLRCLSKKKESTSFKRYIADVVEHTQAHGSWPIRPYEQGTSGLP
ncbi:UNVERIFIED_CONTAM: hypothetical protein Slati_1698600 [Sesamum latifolium]|uniref:RNase H type-1 domain-containing protein n=1 Tax=Sesamum latifolium TaxID=2727402 RepID=A0AAW2WV07_9LAMI